jgi:hypothetical protein
MLISLPNKTYKVLAHACNPSYLGGRDKEDLNSKSALANSSWDSSSKKKTKQTNKETKNPLQKWAGGVAQGEGLQHHKKIAKE